MKFGGQGGNQQSDLRSKQASKQTNKIKKKHFELLICSPSPLKQSKHVSLAYHSSTAEFYTVHITNNSTCHKNVYCRTV